MQSRPRRRRYRRRLRLRPPITIPDELKSKVNIAMQQVKANHPVEAMTLFAELLAAKPDLFTILVERGKLYQQTQDHAKAIADFTAAIAHRPEYVDAYFRRCLSHYETGSYPSAIADCTKRDRAERRATGVPLLSGPGAYRYPRVGQGRRGLDGGNDAKQ